MATRRKPPVKKIKFELTRSGVLGVGVVCFCIFLWMFLLGVWAGQTMLLPPIQDRGIEKQASASGSAKNVPHIEAEAHKKIFKK
ncbi:hypothetical protein [Desulfopila sp. IMCC35008]|uniref:hypothetical protein n=1 Tax=Desulfopila sp. IMCC35008 TaxID=2653858 RepID=UPI0013D24174|nr:hypothetical protein [Desulfopila sp. IMCC35008]